MEMSRPLQEELAAIEVTKLQDLFVDLHLQDLKHRELALLVLLDPEHLDMGRKLQEWVLKHQDMAHKLQVNKEFLVYEFGYHYIHFRKRRNS